MSEQTGNNLDKYKQNTLILETQLTAERGNWDGVIANLAGKVKGDIKYLYEVDADIISYKQIITSEMGKYAMVIYKENRTMKSLVKTRFEWYSTKYQINLKSSGDKMKLIEADVADVQYKIDVLDNHIDFLKGCGENLKQMSYAIKNRLELLNILGVS
jgi:hypothetical protein